MSSRSPAKGEAGFTLLELLITMTVTVIGLMGLLALHLTTSRGNDAASRSAEAVAIAQRTLEDLRAFGVKDMIQEITGDRNTALPIERDLDAVVGRLEMPYRRRIQIEELVPVSPNLIRLHLDVSWTDDNAAPGSEGGVHDHTVSLELIRTRQEAM